MDFRFFDGMKGVTGGKGEMISSFHLAGIRRRGGKVGLKTAQCEVVLQGVVEALPEGGRGCGRQQDGEREHECVRHFVDVSFRFHRGTGTEPGRRGKCGSY
jgi:hypothetical protein